MKVSIFRFIFVIGMLFYTHNSCMAQSYVNYYNIANDAEHDFLSGNYLVSMNKFTELENSYKDLKSKDCFYLGVIYYIIKDTLQGFKYLKKCAQRSGYTVYNISRFIKQSNFLPSKKAINLLDSIEKGTLGTRVKAVKDTLNYFEDQDQICRSIENVDTACDIKNQTLFLKYLKRNGFPNYDLYGDIGDAIFLHIYNNMLYEEYTKYLFEELDKGNIYPFYYAVVVDRRRYDLKLPTLYGAYADVYDPKNPNLQIFENRRKIGLSVYSNGPNSRP